MFCHPACAVGSYSSGHQLPELSELSQWEVITHQMFHPVIHLFNLTNHDLHSINLQLKGDGVSCRPAGLSAATLGLVRLRQDGLHAGERPQGTIHKGRPQNCRDFLPPLPLSATSLTMAAFGPTPASPPGSDVLYEWSPSRTSSRAWVGWAETSPTPPSSSPAGSSTEDTTSVSLFSRYKMIFKQSC